MPANRSARRLADGVWHATLPRLAAFGAAAAAAAAASALHALPGAPAAQPRLNPLSCLASMSLH